MNEVITSEVCGTDNGQGIDCAKPHGHMDECVQALPPDTDEVNHYRTSEWGQRENIYIHVTKPYAWIWRAKTAKGNHSKYWASVQSTRPDAFRDPQLPALPPGYVWHGPFLY